MWLVPGMGDAKGVAGPLLVPTQVAAPAATEAFKKSRRDLPLFISTPVPSLENHPTPVIPAKAGIHVLVG
jgi:hypothetical protein